MNPYVETLEEVVRSDMPTCCIYLILLLFLSILTLVTASAQYIEADADNAWSPIRLGELMENSKVKLSPVPTVDS